jgi:hypothetical protein
MTSLPDARADERFLDLALAEALGDERPPDLLARVHQATAAERARAAQAVDDAAMPAHRERWLVAAILLAGLGLAASLAFVRRQPQVDAHAFAQERAVADPAELARARAKGSALVLIARTDAAGTRLSDAPEHALTIDGEGQADLIPQLRAALGQGAGSAPLPQGAAQAELWLQCDDRSFVRGRLQFDSDQVRFGVAAFARPAPLPSELGSALRAAWQQAASNKVAPRKRVQVRDVAELFAAIAPNTTIELVGGPFVLPATVDDAPRGNAHVRVIEEWQNAVVELDGVHNLHLRAVGVPVRVLGASPGDVLRLRNCKDVCIDGLVLGHVDGLDFGCSAPVVTLHDCDGVRLRDCELFGCGTEGVVAERSHRLAMERCDVHTCRFGVVRFTNCRDLRFAATQFRDCAMVWDSGGLSFIDCAAVAFDGCTVRGMTQDDGARVPLFGVQMDEAIAFRRGAIVGNRCPRVATSKLLLVRHETDERDNGPEVAAAGPGK